MARDWGEFQRIVGEVVKRAFPPSKGWTVKKQKPIVKGELRVDYVAYMGSERVVIDAKFVDTLTTTDVEQVKKYKAKYKASLGIIYISRTTNVPDTVRQRARKYLIDIVRLLRDP